MLFRSPPHGVFQVGLLATALVPLTVVEPETRDATFAEYVAHRHEPPVRTRSTVLGVRWTRDDDPIELRVRVLVRRIVWMIERSAHVPTTGYDDIHHAGFA